MPDLGKVIKGLECCSDTEYDCALQNDCPYSSNYGEGCMLEMKKDALELLKAQDSREILRTSQSVEGTAQNDSGVDGEKEERWISVMDRLPEDGETVLAVKQLKDGRRDICLARCILEWEHYDVKTGKNIKEPYWVCGGNNHILYWMPLPSMPAE